jgi:ADP-ribosylglycohydrolase
MKHPPMHIDELVEHWTILDEDRDLIAGKREATRLGSTIEYHRSQIRTHLGFRTCTTADATKLAVWLAENVAHAERRPERVREELLKHLREERIEPPTPGRISRIVASALHNAEVTWPLIGLCPVRERYARCGALVSLRMWVSGTTSPTC